MNTILVTGGAGFIGTNLIEALLKRKDISRVICIDNLDPFYNPKFKKENMKQFAMNKRFVFYKTDIRNESAIKKIFTKEKPDYVVHLAAKADTRKSVENVREYAEVNVLGTLHMLECAKNTKVKKFIFISSSSVYGNSAKPPFKESDITDEPLAPYGATKKAGEILGYTYFHNFVLPVTCLRLFNAYGERNRPDLVIYTWVEKILQGKSIKLSGGGTRKRDFTYVGDIVEAIFLAMRKKSGYEVLNIGNSRSVTLKELLGKIEKVTGMHARIESRPSHSASVEITCADIKRAKKVIDWEPKTTLDEGLVRFVKWFRENRLKNSV